MHSAHERHEAKIGRLPPSASARARKEPSRAGRGNEKNERPVESDTDADSDADTDADTEGYFIRKRLAFRFHLKAGAKGGHDQLIIVVDL